MLVWMGIYIYMYILTAIYTFVADEECSEEVGFSEIPHYVGVFILCLVLFSTHHILRDLHDLHDFLCHRCAAGGSNITEIPDAAR